MDNFYSKLFHCLETTGIRVKTGGFLVEDKHEEMKGKFIPPTGPLTENHIYAAEGILQALETLRKDYPSIYARFKEEYSIVPVAHSDTNVSMSTLRGKIGRFLLFNINSPIDAKPVGIVAEKFLKALPDDTSLADRIRLNYKIVTFHELGHVIDGFSNDMLSEALYQMSEKLDCHFEGYLARKVSGYATVSPQEAIAEIIALILGKGDVPKPFRSIAGIIQQISDDYQEHKLAA